MKALVYDWHGPPDVLEVRELPPPVPGPGEALVEVHALPVGPGDCKLRAGALGAQFNVRFPKIPGRYASGCVVSVGAGLGWPRVGDEVVLASPHGDSGTAAELVVARPDRMAPKPVNLSHVETAAMIQGGASALACLTAAGPVARGTHLLIQGAGGAVGSACIELAKQMGYRVAGLCRSSDLDLVRSLGAHEAFAFDRPGEVAGAPEQDVVIDLVGGEVHAQSHALLRRGGRLVYLNALPRVAAADKRNVDVVNAPVEASAEVLAKVVELAERGVLRPRVAACLPLAEAAAAHALVERGRTGGGRVVLRLC